MLRMEDFFVGDIKKCTKLKTHVLRSGEVDAGYLETEDEVTVYSAMLYKSKNDNYVDVMKYFLTETIMNDLIPTVSATKKLGLLMKTYPTKEGDYFVDEATIRPYQTYAKNNGKDLQSEMLKNAFIKRA